MQTLLQQQMHAQSKFFKTQIYLALKIPSPPSIEKMQGE